jgi:hypothetical protein
MNKVVGTLRVPLLAATATMKVVGTLRVPLPTANATQNSNAFRIARRSNGTRSVPTTLEAHR